MNNKITAEEIQLLRQNAENEREKHAQIMRLLHAIEIGANPPLSEAQQMEIVGRGREDEVLALIDVYDGKFGHEPSLSDEVQLYIYDKLPKAKESMLRSMHLCYRVECRIFDDDTPLYAQEGEVTKEFYPRFSPEGEEYMVKSTLKNCEKQRTITNELYFLQGYTKEYRLTNAGEVALMKFLSSTYDRSPVLDALENFVIGYLAKYKELCAAAQLEMVRSDDHKVIMYYIENALECIKEEKVIDELLNRGEREEVTAYFNRYAVEK